MAKKRRKKQAPEVENPLVLPQNIISVGERVFEDRNVYIHQKAYKAIHRFAAGKTTNESGGILVGRVVTDLGKENTIIEAFIPGKHTEATPTTLTFTHETWEHFHSELEKKHKGMKIVGWIHTHPDFGIFLSENDRFIHNNFFSDPNQVAYVVDPVQEEEGFYFWIDGKLERCPGFYVFDKVGTSIKIDDLLKDDNDDVEEKKGNSGSSPFINVLLIALIILLVIVNSFTFLRLSNRINALEQVNAILNQNIEFCVNQINTLHIRLESLSTDNAAVDNNSNDGDSGSNQAQDMDGSNTRGD